MREKRSGKVCLARALVILDSVAAAGLRDEDWSLGGGIVLMLMHRHRFSKNIDIFVPDPQYLGLLTPRLCDAAEVGVTSISKHSRRQTSGR